MVRHIVLLTLDRRADAGRRAAIVEALEALPPLIPSVRRYDVQPDAGLAEGNADIAVVAEFDDDAGWAEYRDHPAHQRVLQELILPVLASRVAHQARL